MGKGKVIEFVVRIKMAIGAFTESILSSPSSTVIATGAIFLVSIVVFALTYMFLHEFHQVSLVRYKDKNIVGGAVPLPAFQVSDALRKRIEVKAKNDLRLREFVGDSTNVA
ncbi:MAG: hypothetical protein ACXVB4_15590, partial [Pseudobdellovibrionaceae bacterium]